MAGGAAAAPRAPLVPRRDAWGAAEAAEDGGGTPPPVPLSLLQYDPPVRGDEAERQYGYVGTVQKALDTFDGCPRVASEEEVLDCILPPRDLGGGWVQYVRNSPATRFELRDLSRAFERHLRESKARESGGVCPVRRTVYSMCFDELIRQVAVDCAEQGLLLLRIRDELRMTLAGYQTLYKNSVGFGLRKAVEAEQGQDDMAEHLAQLARQKEELSKEAAQLRAKLQAMRRCCQEQEEADHKKFAMEVGFLQETNARLTSQEKMIKEAQEEERRRFLHQ